MERRASDAARLEEILGRPLSRVTSQALSGASSGDVDEVGQQDERGPPDLDELSPWNLWSEASSAGPLV